MAYSSLRPFHSMSMKWYEQKGIAEKVYLRGRLMAESGKFVGEKGIGKQAWSKPYALAYDKFKG